MAKRPNVAELIRLLKTRYGNVECALDHKNAYELVVATILSAQCTDKRVNMVTPELFRRYPTARELAAAQQADVEELVRTTGFFRNKAKNLIGMAKGLVARHDGEVPRSMDELLELPGVARKTANVVLGTAYGIAGGVVVDTHVARLTNLLGLTDESDPVRIERDLMKAVPERDWILFSHMLIHHGREICIANRPKCEACLLNQLCPSAFKAKGALGKQAAKKGATAAKKQKRRRAPAAARAKLIRSR